MSASAWNFTMRSFKHFASYTFVKSTVMRSLVKTVFFYFWSLVCNRFYFPRISILHWYELFPCPWNLVPIKCVILNLFPINIILKLHIEGLEYQLVIHLNSFQATKIFLLTKDKLFTIKLAWQWFIWFNTGKPFLWSKVSQRRHWCAENLHAEVINGEMLLSMRTYE